MWVAGYLALVQGDGQAARGLLEEALTAGESLGDVRAVAYAAQFLGRALWLDRPGNPRGCETWEDAGSWWHSGSIRRSCVNAR